MKNAVVIALVISIAPLPSAALAQEATSFRRPSQLKRSSGLWAASGERHLAPIALTPILQLARTKSDNDLVPQVQGDGQGYLLGGAASPLSLLGQVKLSFRPEPTVGASTAVAQKIRLNAGLVTANIGAKFSWFPAGETSTTDRGSVGIEVRAAALGSFQSARTQDQVKDAAGVQQQAPVEQASFGVLAPEVTGCLWLAYVYVGYSFRTYATFGDAPAALADGLKGPSHRFLGIVPVVVGSSTDSQGTKREQQMYIELSYAGGQGTLGSGSVAFSLSTSFEAL